ncbi:uncharacterized protein [Dysidea avara]|uniref:uncharacterized protein isoform X2 n=1 Tax=Dysidea avara TaxID=196820 RepID=UPI0033211EA0
MEFLPLFIGILVISRECLSAVLDDQFSTCEPVQSNICKGLSNGYNSTRFPSDFFTDQAQAILQFDTFSSLIESKCSTMLTKFLCTYYFPPCGPNITQHIWPCEVLCEVVRHDCEPVMKRHGFSWPTYFDCSRFPSNQPCVDIRTLPAPTAATPTTPQATATSSDVAVPTPTPVITPVEPIFGETCQTVNNSMCASLHPSYSTYFPHKNYLYQELAVKQFNSFQLLIDSNCSTKLKPFLCTSHFPACVMTKPLELQLIYPCRHLCKQVRRSCEPVLLRYNHTWPSHLECDNFPSKDGNLCADSAFLTTAIPKPTSSPSTPTPSVKPTDAEKCEPIDSRVRETCGMVHENYTHTHFPHGKFVNQNDAYNEFITFLPLIRSNCSAELRAYLCYQYFPSCSFSSPTKLIGPCRSVCRKSHTNCVPCLQNHHVQLPSCDTYPVKGTCIGLNDLRAYLRSSISTSTCSISTEPPTTNSTTASSPTPPGCEHCRVKDLSKKALKSNYDFVAKVRVLTEVVNSQTFYYSVVVQEFFYPFSKSAVPISILRTQSSANCPCIQLKVNREYLITGNFNNNGIMTLPNDGAIVKRWSTVVYSHVKELVEEVYS